jgi:hypothetical protein
LRFGSPFPRSSRSCAIVGTNDPSLGREYLSTGESRGKSR